MPLDQDTWRTLMLDLIIAYKPMKLVKVIMATRSFD